MSNLKEQINFYTTLVESKLEELVPESKVLEQELYHAARYSLLEGGKRFRPILTLAVADLFGASLDSALTPACAIEMIHTYSMIHDDLPCMDDDNFRRGKPSLHKQYPEAIAVLAGDYLLTKAFEVISSDEKLTAEQRTFLVKIISKAAGGSGMIGGQVIDILTENKSIDLITLQELHKKKTGALISSAISSGCFISGATEEQTNCLNLYAENLGLAFQVVDDILDITSGDKKRGPQTSSDVSNNKNTYVSLLGLDEAKKVARQLYKSAISSLDQLPQETTFLKKLAEFVVLRDY